MPGSGADGRRGKKRRMDDDLRRDRHVMVSGDRIPGLAGISAPVWNSAHELVGALTLTAPEQRVQKSFVDEVRQSADRLTAALGGSPV